MESEETLRQTDEGTNKILQAIGGLSRKIVDLRQDMRQKIKDLRREMNGRFTKIEYAALNIGHDLKADVKIPTA